jgi:hypothetical protein
VNRVRAETATTTSRVENLQRISLHEGRCKESGKWKETSSVNRVRVATATNSRVENLQRVSLHEGGCEESGKWKVE